MALAHTRGFRPHIYTESPWYWPIAPLLKRFDALDTFPSPDMLTTLYEECTFTEKLPALRFEASRKIKKKRARKRPVDLTELYEGRIIERGEVPTRPDDWHDLFNALAFMTFPRAKRALHLRQYNILRNRVAPNATRLPNARTREQDALSLFDEGGIAVAAKSALVEQLRRTDNDDALERALHTADVRVVPFGHALWEHLVAGLPCPFGTVHVVPVAHAQQNDSALLDALDRALSESLADQAYFQLPSDSRGISLSALPVALAAPLAHTQAPQNPR